MKLKVPSNISLETELFRGFNKKAVIITSIVTIISLIIAIIIFLIFGDTSILFCTSLVLFTVFISTALLTKMDNNLSIVDFILNMINFMKSQQIYTYKSEVNIIEKN